MSTGGSDQASPEPVFTTGRARWRAPVRRHRRPGAGRGGSVLAALLVLVGVVVAGGMISGSQLSVDDRLRPFVTVGDSGRPVSGDSFDLQVLAVTTAAAIADRPGRRHDTGGVWVLVLVQVMARDEVATIGTAEVRDSRGRSWAATERVHQPLAGGGYQFQPGVLVEGEIAFEVPGEVAGDLTVRVGQAGRLLPFMAAMIEVRLPVDEAMLAQSLAEAEALAELAAGEVAAEEGVEVEPVLLAPPRVVFPPLLTGSAP